MDKVVLRLILLTVVRVSLSLELRRSQTLSFIMRGWMINPLEATVPKKHNKTPTSRIIEVLFHCNTIIHLIHVFSYFCE